MNFEQMVKLERSFLVNLAMKNMFVCQRCLCSSQAIAAAELTNLQNKAPGCI